jgi:aspartyl-tRNA(Asn)/glutamyl-tRNA(Gln) amidotransferase subunit C
MAKKIDDETIEYIGILSKLELSEEERQQAGTDMGKMLDYIDKMQELDTEGVEPMSHIFRMENVFREDVVTNADAGEQMLVNAPQQKDNMFVVPPTF